MWSGGDERLAASEKGGSTQGKGLHSESAKERTDQSTKTPKGTGISSRAAAPGAKAL